MPEMLTFLGAIASLLGIVLLFTVAIIPLCAIAISIRNSGRIRQLEETIEVMSRRIAMMDDPINATGRDRVNQMYPDDPKTQSWQAPVPSDQPGPLGPKLENDRY